jgi:hypothetical protein
MIAQKYQKTLSKIKPYIFTFGKNLDSFNLNPFGIPISQELIFDCSKISSASFFDLITKMDAITFGGQGMGMERWVLYDCSAMPGAIFGFAIPASQLNERVKQQMQLDDKHEGYVPISMFIAIPMSRPKHWFGHNLSSLNTQLDNQLPGLGLLTKAFGLKCMRIAHQYGATQWNNPALNIHIKLSALELITVYTPIHTHKHTLTYLAHYTDESLHAVLADQERPYETSSLILSGKDYEHMQLLQTRIEKGERFTLESKGKIVGETTLYNLCHKKVN